MKDRAVSTQFLPSPCGIQNLKSDVSYKNDSPVGTHFLLFPCAMMNSVIWFAYKYDSSEEDDESL